MPHSRGAEPRINSTCNMHARENLRGKDLISYLLAHIKTNWTSCRNVISALFLRSSGTESPPPLPRALSPFPQWGGISHLLTQGTLKYHTNAGSLHRRACPPTHASTETRLQACTKFLSPYLNESVLWGSHTDFFLSFSCKIQHRWWSRGEAVRGKARQQV